MTSYQQLCRERCKWCAAGWPLGALPNGHQVRNDDEPWRREPCTAPSLESAFEELAKENAELKAENTRLEESGRLGTDAFVAMEDRYKAERDALRKELNKSVAYHHCYNPAHNLHNLMGERLAALERIVEGLMQSWQRPISSDLALASLQVDALTRERDALLVERTAISVCPLCGRTENSQGDGGNERCFHCACGYMQCVLDLRQGERRERQSAATVITKGPLPIRDRMKEGE